MSKIAHRFVTHEVGLAVVRCLSVLYRLYDFVCCHRYSFKWRIKLKFKKLNISAFEKKSFEFYANTKNTKSQHVHLEKNYFIEKNFLNANLLQWSKIGVTISRLRIPFIISVVNRKCQFNLQMAYDMCKVHSNQSNLFKCNK